MSDTGRKGMTDKLSEGVTPDSQKSTLDKAKESVTDAGDKVAGLAY
jgi:Heat shock protein 9/12